MTTHRRKNLRLFLALLFMPWLLNAASWAVSVTVSSPTSGSTVSSSFKINAKASSSRQITAWYIYADSKAVWHTTSDVASISAPITLSQGSHTVLVRAWDSSGAYSTATLKLNVSGTSSGTSSGVTVTVSKPSTSTASVGSPVNVVASASSSRAITAWYIYSDGKAVWHTTSDVKSINATFSLSSGTHQMTIRAWDSSGATGTQYMTFKVGTATSGTSGTADTSGVPQPPSGAKVISGIENKSGWGHCTKCAANPADPDPPLASWSFHQFQNTPSMDGSSLKMGIYGSDPYANVLHWIKFGNQNSYKNFIWEFYVYGSEASLKAQNLEFDLFQAVNGRKYMFGSQCNYKKGIWQAWNHINKWVDLPTVPCKKFAPGKWTRVVWYMKRTWDRKMHYVSLTIGDTTYKVNSYQPTYDSSWGDTFGVQYQQDMDKYATDYTIWVDKVKVSMW
jgi:hypothetical protein